MSKSFFCLNVLVVFLCCLCLFFLFFSISGFRYYFEIGCMLFDVTSEQILFCYNMLLVFLFCFFIVIVILRFHHSSEGKGSYTTLGHQLGTSLRELHRCLALALLSEKFPGALVRTLKTIELLVENVNYSKLKPRLLTKIVTHVKYFMRYKGR